MSNPSPSDHQLLRQRAEHNLANRAVPHTPEAFAALTAQAQADLLHELQVHQIELEMQNDELRRTQATLDTEKARYFDFYDLAPVGYLTVSQQAAILQANLTTAKLLGVPRVLLIGKALAGFILKSDADRYYLLCRDALSSGHAQSAELRLRHADGQAFWVQLQAIAATGDDGAAVIRIVLSDVTQRRQADEKLRASEESYRALAHDMPSFICAFLPDGTLTYVNAALAASVGLPAQDLIGHNFADHLSPTDRASVAARLAALTPAQPLETHEQLFLAADRRAYTHQWTNRAFFDQAGNMTRLQAIGHDITERKQAEARLLANKQFRDAILDSIPSQIAVLDHNGCILAVNQRWREFALANSPTSGEPANNTQLGTNYLNICLSASSSDADGSAAQARDGILRVMHGSAPSFYLEYPCHSPTQQHWFSLAVTPLNIDNQAVVVTHTDITERRQMEQAAKEAREHKFRLVADNTSDGIVIFGADQHIEYVSPAYVKQLGYSEAEERNRSPDQIYALIHPQDRDALFARLECAIAAKASDLLYSYRIQHRLGHYLWREDHARFQYDESGNYLGACVVARDITERRQAEIDLQVSELRFRRLIAELPVGAVLHGPDCEILLGNAMALDLLGLSEDQLLGKTSFDPHWNVIHEDGTPFPGPTHPAPQAIASGQPVNNVVMGVFRPTTQNRVWLLVNAHPQLTPDGRKQVVVTFSDITERNHAQAAMLEINRKLRQSRQQLRHLVSFNETMLEKEKRHIAREVHDELGQVLTALRMDLSLSIIRHASQVPDLLEALMGMKTQVDRAIQGVRNVATSLRPAVLDMGLVPSITWLCQEFTRHSDVACELKAPDGNLALDASRAVVVFRIVQESLNNISKYAQASQVSVSLSQQGNELRLAVRDNGIGFDPVVVAQRGSLGLLGMRERVLALGGQVEVTSTPGAGTGIAVVIPLDPDAAKEPA